MGLFYPYIIRNKFRLIDNIFNTIVYHVVLINTTSVLYLLFDD
ncbi:hypothetical protein NIES25_68620 (plasmid) [Nostoc linckia NIES-25]|nr:hypothetical protein NIES25_68620 [Nostoc linckia NIES-25]